VRHENEGNTTGTKSIQRWVDVKTWDHRSIGKEGKRFRNTSMRTHPQGSEDGYDQDEDYAERLVLDLKRQQVVDEDIERCIEYDFLKPKYTKENYPLNSGDFLSRNR